jgi:hypothetical protein
MTKPVVWSFKNTKTGDTGFGELDVSVLEELRLPRD